MKAVVCGAGIAGLALARQLSTRGWDVVVVEKAPGPRTQGYMIDFFGAGYDAAEAMGVLPRFRQLGYHVEEARFVDGTGRRRARLRYEQFVRGVGDRMMSIMRPDIELALRQSLPDTVKIRYATTLTHIEDGTDRVRVTLAGGEVLDADLLVGADGIHSTVRALVFGEERNFLHYLGFHTAAYTFHDPAIHAKVRDAFWLTDSVGRQMGLYGLRDGRVATFVVHRSTDPTLPADPVATLRAEYDSLGWVVPDALAQCPPAGEVYYDQVAQIRMPRWHRGRVVLVGDACYAVSLLAGQGVTRCRGRVRARGTTPPRAVHSGRSGSLRTTVAPGGRGETTHRTQGRPLVPAPLNHGVARATRHAGDVGSAWRQPSHRRIAGRQADHGDQAAPPPARPGRHTRTELTGRGVRPFRAPAERPRPNTARGA
jgi:2-polyprenyl-6-methoxyphenol hydroxylase-like FAD-dependent oxidoreductase